MSVVIRVKDSGILYLDIHHKGGRNKLSTGLKDTASNRKLLQDEIIPRIEKEISLGTFVPKAKKNVIIETVEDYGERSFARHMNERRNHVTASYKRHFSNHIVPYFGKRLISSITSMELLDWQNKKLETFEVSTVKKFRSVFYTIFTDAFLEGIVDQNPFDRVARPVDLAVFDDSDAMDEDDKNINPYTLKEIENLISKAAGYLKNFIAIMAFTGMRPGELVALKYKDLDFTNNIIKIRRTRTLGENGPTKTKSSKRDIEMLPIVKQYLLLQKELTFINIDGDVFLNKSKKIFYSHDTIAVSFKRLTDNDPRYLYQLRHSFASLMISEGEDMLWVSRVMGHKSLDITLKIYTHAYSVTQDKNGRKQRAKFLTNVPNPSPLI